MHSLSPWGWPGSHLLAGPANLVLSLNGIYPSVNPHVNRSCPHSQPTASQQTVLKLQLDRQYNIFDFGSTILGCSTPCLHNITESRNYLCLNLYMDWRRRICQIAVMNADINENDMGAAQNRTVYQPRPRIEKYKNSFLSQAYDDVIKWKHFLRYWPFVQGIHRSPVNSPHKGKWRGALMFIFWSASE